MANETTLELKFKVNDDGSVVLDKIGKKLSETGEHVEKMKRSLSVIKLDSLINLGERFYHMGKQGYDAAREIAAFGDEIERNARTVGMTIEEYQKWQHVAFRSDVETEKFASGMKLLSKNMFEAAGGSKEALEGFEILGLEVKDQQGKLKTYDSILEEIADQFAKMPDGPEKVALALKIFGRSGEAMIPLLNKGREGVEELKKEFDELGTVLSEKTVKALSLADEQFERFETRIKGLWRRGSADFAKGLGAILDVFTRLSTGESFKNVILEMREIYSVLEMGTPTWIKEWVKAYDPIKKVTDLTEKQVKWISESKALIAQMSWEDYASGAIQVDKATQELTLSEKKRREEMERIYFLEKQILTLKEAQQGIEQKALVIAARFTAAGMGATKAELMAWGQEIADEWGVLIGSKMFDEKELEAYKNDYLLAIEQGQKAWEGKGVDKLFEDLKKVVETTKIADTEGGKIQEQLVAAEEELKKLLSLEKEARQPVTVSVDDSGVIRAANETEELRRRLEELVNRSWEIHVSLWGHASTQLPLIEKIAEISQAFEQFGSEYGNMVLNFNLESITRQIAKLEEEAYAVSQMRGYVGNYQYVEEVKQRRGTEITEQISQLKEMYEAMSSYGSYGGGGGFGGGSDSGGGISINIGVINIGAGGGSVAESLDAELATLWEKDRSKLKRAIQS